MINRKVLFGTITALVLMTALLFAGAVGQAADHELTIMSTTDIHQYLLPYDYMADAPDEEVGFSKVYSLIDFYEEEVADNTLLVDNGDFIQGSLIGVYESQIEPLEEGETQTIVEVYNEVGYEAAAVGNHELQDYPMSFFEKARDGAEFPFLAANIKLADNEDEHYVEPYTVVEKEMGGETLKVGIIGFIPPQTMRWGSDHLEGNVVIEDIIPAAEEYLPELEEKSDIIVALGHTGISDAPQDSYDARENAGYYLAQMEEIDAMILGHHHNKFPGNYEDMEGVDNEAGTIHGVPTVMPGSWGDSLGIIDLGLNYEDGSWEVVESEPRLSGIDEDVPSHPLVEDMAKDVHESTIEYVRTPIGETERDITSYLARVMDSSVTQIVHEAQLWWAENTFAEGEYSDLPILSAAAPFQAGREDAEYFTEVGEDGVTIGDVTDIYIYDNQVRVMKINGEEVIEWLERSAENFNQIDPDSSEEQELLDPDFSAYNYDVIEGINYEVDVTKPEGERIVNATYDGDPLTAEDEFLVVTNDYRAGGGGDFPPCVENDPVYAPSGVVSREEIINYVSEKGTVNPKPTYNWNIKPFDPAGTVTFRSHPEAIEYVDKYEIPGIEKLREDDNGMGVYSIDVSEPITE